MYLFILFGCGGSSLLPELSQVAVSRGFSLGVVLGLLIVVASLVAKHGSRAHGLSSCGSWALEHRFNSCGAQA